MCRNFSCPVCAASTNRSFFNKPLIIEATQTGQLKFLHMSGITLRPGGTPEISRWWNHRDCDPILSSPGGATDRDRSVAPPGLGGSTVLVPVVTPLISTAPPARRHV